MKAKYIFQHAKWRENWISKRWSFVAFLSPYRVPTFTRIPWTNFAPFSAHQNGPSDAGKEQWAF